MTDDRSADAQGLRDRLAREGQDALGKLAQDLLENPLVAGALRSAFDAREKASAAQEVAMGALNLPSAADLERLTRRVRSVSQRLEGIEDGVDRLDERLAAAAKQAGEDTVSGRLSAVEEALTALTAELAALRTSLPTSVEPIPREQERLEVESAGA